MKFSSSVVLFLLVATIGGAASPRVQLTTLPDRVRVEIEGALFTEYRFGKELPKPFLYPIVATDGTRLTRDYPMAETAGEERDHVHHRSLWFAHGDVNGHDLWTEDRPKSGRVVHTELVEATGGESGLLRTRNRWLGNDGKELCTDETTIRVTPVSNGRLLDYEVTVLAPADREIVLGDTKEGTMAIRLAQGLTMPHKMQGRDVPGSGRILTASGHRDREAWGKRADWCDYTGTLQGKVHGITIFDHPKNPNYPTWWMVRDYGLFAANPFGKHDFENLKDQPRAGEMTIPRGQKLTFRYRFYFHAGETTPAELTKQFEAFAETAR